MFAMAWAMDRPALAGHAEAISQLTLRVKYTGPASMLSFGPTPGEGIAGAGAGAIDGYGDWEARQTGQITRTDDSWKLAFAAEARASSPPRSRAVAKRKAKQGVILSVFVDPHEFDESQRFSLEFATEHVAIASASVGYARASADYSINGFFESTGHGIQIFPSVPLSISAPPNGFLDYSPDVRTLPIVLDPGFRFTVTLRKAEVGAQAIVPEPLSWALMIAGFELVGTVLRMRRAVGPAGAPS